MSLLLFVVCMEYLSRIMTYIDTQHEFKFHSRCNALKLNRLCFADNLILFYKGDSTSVNMMLQGVKLFSDTTGLCANKNKSEVYSCGMGQNEVANIAERSGFKVGSLPFKYLGVSVSAKKLTTSDCEKMVKKMVAIIKVWSSRHISFPGTLQLINSVLMSLNVYWSQISILPKSVLKKINAI